MDEIQTENLIRGEGPHPKSVLVVEDDKRLSHCLARAMEARGFKAMTAESVNNGLAQIELAAPEFAIADMRLGNGCGLDIISALKQRRPDARSIILTGYGNIATAVKAGVAAEIAHREPPINVLINNAGALFGTRRLTEDGLEKTHPDMAVRNAGRNPARQPSRIPQCQGMQ